MTRSFRVIHPNGQQDIVEIGPDADTLSLLKAAVGGWIEYLPAHYHALSTHEVVINEEGLVGGLPPNWIGSRLIGMDLTQSSPLHGPVVIVPHDPEDGPSPAQQRQRAASPDNMVNLYARALEGDVEALKSLGVDRPDQITMIDARFLAPHHIYLIHPDGHTERRAVGSNEEGQTWIDSKLGEAYRVPEAVCGVCAYAVIYSAAPGDVRPNIPAQKALALSCTVCGPVVLVSTGEPDPSPIHQRLDEALSGDAAARTELGLTADW